MARMAPDERTVDAGRSVDGAAGTDYRRVLRRQTIARALRMRPVYLLLSISLAMVILWRYVPIYGLSLAFKDFSLHNGWIGSSWNDFDHFKRMVTDPFFGRVLFNTVWLSVLRILFAFPAPIIMALLLNEMRSPWYKRTVQSVSYLPHFVSWVILGGIFAQILNLKRGPIAWIFVHFVSWVILGGIFAQILNLKRGPIAWIFVQLGLEPINWLTHEPTFRGLMVVTGIWQSVGWATILYLAALASADPNLYEAAEIDGANRFQRVLHITLPALVPVITILLLLQVANLFDDQFDQIFNMSNASVINKVDIFGTFIYRSGVVQAQFDYTIAVGLFQNVAGLAVLLLANWAVRRLGYGAYGVW